MNSIFEHLRNEPHADLASARVGVLGCGSVGSHIAWQLASAGIGALALVDRDRIEAGNLRRHVASTMDIGELKTTVVQRFLRDRFPNTRYHAEVFDVVEELDRTERWLENTDLVIVAVDSESPKYLVDSLCRRCGIPAIYGGVYGAGWAVELIHATPTGPCYGCIARTLGRVGVAAELPVNLAYAMPSEALASGWILADVGSIQLAAGYLSRLACNILQARHGHTAAISEWSGSAWRFPLRAIPAWNAQPWQRITVDVASDPTCLLCGLEGVP